jgi:hypothetical protein
MANLVGKDGRLFAEQQPSADPTSFQVDNTSKSYYDSPIICSIRISSNPCRHRVPHRLR